MKTAGIICEYNPFHNGHRYHIEQTREKFGATHIVAVMSGNFTQRGDVAITDKFTRAKTALENGVDLVIELPVAYAMASAEQFAYGASYLLNSLGCVDMLSFGSECGDVDLLGETAGAVIYAQNDEYFLSLMRKGDNYPTALQKTIEKYYEDDVIEALTTPNNTLGIEYIKALDSMGSFIKPVTIKRGAVAHDSEEVKDGFASASEIRRRIKENQLDGALLPETDISDYADISRLETAILAKMRTMTKTDMEKLPNVYLGLENRLYKAVHTAKSLDELQNLIKTKRYTMARIRRIILSAFIGLTKNDLKNPPAYVRIIGMNEKGREILSACDCKLPMDTSLMALAQKNARCKKQAMLEERAGNLYALAFEKTKGCGLEFTSRPIIIKD